MPKRKTPELSPKEQFKRFQETAKELGVDEAQSEVERNFSTLSKRTLHRQKASKPVSPGR